MVSLYRKVASALKHRGISGLTERINKRVGIIGGRTGLTGKTCLRPYYFAGIAPGGEIYSCCAGWVKFRLGRLSARQDIGRIWNGRIAGQFRDAMYHTDLGRVCHEDRCPYIIDNRLPSIVDGRVKMADDAGMMYTRSIIDDREVLDALESRKLTLDYLPKHIEIGVDSRCNLYCRSCRETRISSLTVKEGKILDLSLSAVHDCGRDLKMLSLLGSGEVFYSAFGMELLRSLNREAFPFLQVDLMTNGQLFSQTNWEKTGNGRDFISSVTVSIDAACRKTYEWIRRGGKWDVLMENMSFIRTLRQTGKLTSFSICFVVSADNFREMPAFVEMGDKYGVDNVIFTGLQPWSSMTFNHTASDVTAEGHPLHQEYTEIIKNPLLKKDFVVLGL